eukprot:15792-Heterococcus_DN1.PRE.3
MDHVEQYDGGLGLHSSVAIGVMSTNSNLSDAVHDDVVYVITCSLAHRRMLACTKHANDASVPHWHTHILSLVTGGSRMLA